MSPDTQDKLALAGLLAYGVVTAPFVLLEAVRRRLRTPDSAWCWTNEEVDRW